jgi:hypothetical protein
LTRVAVGCARRIEGDVLAEWQHDRARGRGRRARAGEGEREPEKGQK